MDVCCVSVCWVCLGIGLVGERVTGCSAAWMEEGTRYSFVHIYTRPTDNQRIRYEGFADPAIPKFMYGSHYSTAAGVVLHYLVRLQPFADLHREMQVGGFGGVVSFLCAP